MSNDARIQEWDIVKESIARLDDLLNAAPPAERGTLALAEIARQLIQLNYEFRILQLEVARVADNR